MGRRAIAALLVLGLAACGGGDGGGAGGGGGGGLPGPPAGPQLVHSQPPGAVFTLAGAADDVIAYETTLPVAQTRRVRNIVTGADAELQNAASSNAFAMTNEWVYGNWLARPATNCTSSCVLRWPITGGAPAVLPSDGGGQASLIKAKGRFAAWMQPAGASISVHDAQTGLTGGPVIRTAGVDILDFDLAVVNGAVVLYYWLGQPATVPVRGMTLYRWTEAGGSEVVAGASSTNSPGSGLQPEFTPRVATDGNLVAYTAWTSAAGGSPASVSVVVRPTTSSGTPVTIGGATSAIALRDGVAVWSENVPGSGAGATSTLMAWSQARGTETLGSGPHPAVLTAASGFAVYGVGPSQALYSWNGTTGARVKRTDSSGFARFATGNWLYFIDGASIYRVSLN